MKGIAAFTVLFLLIGFGLSAQTVAPHVWTFAGYGTGYPGFNPDNYPGLVNPEAISLSGSSKTARTDGIRMQQQMDYLNSKIGFAGPLGAPRNQVIIGHSQGGLRALAYGAQVVRDAQARNLPPEDFIKGVITIDSPVQGFSTLRQGKDVINNKLLKYQSTLQKGWNAVVSFLIASGVFTYMSEADIWADLATQTDAETINQAKNLLHDPHAFAKGLDSHLKPGINSADDMTVDSTWYQNNIASSGHLNFFIYYINSWGWMIPMLGVEWVPGQGKIPQNVKTGHITGSDHSFDNVMAYNVLLSDRLRFPSGEANFTNSTEAELTALAEKIKAGRQKIKGLLDTGIWVMDFITQYGIDPNNPDNYVPITRGSVTYTRIPDLQNWNDAMHSLRDLIDTPDAALADILGSSDNDGLIPLPDQFADNQNLGGTPIDSRYPHRNVPVNHFQARFAKEVWGTEGYGNVGFDKNKVGQNGAVREYLRALGLPPSVETTNQRWDLWVGQ